MTGGLMTAFLLVGDVFFLFLAGDRLAAFVPCLGVFSDTFFFGTGLFFRATFRVGAISCRGVVIVLGPVFVFFDRAFRSGAALFLGMAFLPATNVLGLLAGFPFGVRVFAAPVVFDRPDSRRVACFGDAPWDCRCSAARAVPVVRFAFDWLFSLARRRVDGPARLPDLRVDFAIQRPSRS